MPQYMIDTNTCIAIRRNRPKEVLERFRSLKVGDAVMSVITLGELWFGVEKSGEPAHREALARLSSLIPARPLDEQVAQAYGRVRADLERRGQKIGNNDLWIAAHARSLGLILVTNNEREFARVPDLKLENWALPA